MTPQWQLDAELQDTIDNERLAGRRRPRCTARVNDYALELRNRDSPTPPSMRAGRQARRGSRTLGTRSGVLTTQVAKVADRV